MIDQQATAERQAAIAAVMAGIRARRLRLAELLERGAFPAEDHLLARTYNKSTHPVLAECWACFLDMPVAEQLQALREGDSFMGSSWQSLMQANPYALTPTWRAP